jgi:hypothetical protein
MEWRASRYFTIAATIGSLHAIILEPRGRVMDTAATVHSGTHKTFLDVAPVRSALDGSPGPSAETASQTTAPVEGGSSAELADILSMAVELNRNCAMKRNIRIRCHALDKALKSEDQPGLLQKLSRLLGCAIQNAQWGSRVTCRAGIRNGETRLHLRFAVPTSAAAASRTGIDWVDELWSWPLSETAAHVH